MEKIRANLLKSKDAKLQGLMFSRAMTAWPPNNPSLGFLGQQAASILGAAFFYRIIRLERWFGGYGTN
jgi:hypothetical protein